MGGLVAERTTSQGDGHHTSASCLPCLRDKYHGDSLSTEASEHMLASWRTKFSQAYNYTTPCSENGLKEMSKQVAVSVNVSIFSDNSVRGASPSATEGVGVTMNDIMQAAD